MIKLYNEITQIGNIYLVPTYNSYTTLYYHINYNINIKFYLIYLHIKMYYLN